MSVFYKIKILGYEINPFHLIAFSNFLFIGLYLFLSFYNRISTDDFYFLNSVNKYGIVGGTIHEHATWSGRWTSVLLTHFVLFFHKLNYSLFLYQVSILLLFITSIYRLLKNLNYLFWQVALKSSELLNTSIFIISAFFYTCFKIDETWFWLCASSNYLLSVVFFILGISAIINPKKSIFNFTLTIFSFTYLGGSCEPLALFSSFILLLFALGIYLKRTSIPLPTTLLFSRTLTAFLFCLGSFVLLYIANGNRIREQFFEDISVFECFLINFKTTGMIVLLRLPTIILYLILFSVPAFYLGLSQKVRPQSKKTLFKRIVTIGIVYGLLIYIYQFPVTYVTKDIAAYRALFPITLLTFLTSMLIFYHVGLMLNLKEEIKQFFLLASLIGVIILNIYTLSRQISTVPKYTKAYDERIDLLLKNKNNPETNCLVPLPNSGLLLSAEISSDTSFFSNTHLKLGLGIKSNIKLKKNN